MNHTAYIRKTKKMTLESLRFVIKDCQEAIEANPDNIKNGDYADEICYCGMELKRRERV